VVSEPAIPFTEMSPKADFIPKAKTPIIALFSVSGLVHNIGLFSVSGLVHEIGLFSVGGLVYEPHALTSSSAFLGN
jgi:hypothetical protein